MNPTPKTQHPPKQTETQPETIPGAPHVSLEGKGGSRTGASAFPDSNPATTNTKNKKNPGTWAFTMPMPDKFINSNDRLHWAKKAKLTKAWREAAHWYAKAAGLPKGLRRVHVLVEIHKSTTRKYDAGNLAPTAKAVVDGLVDYGLVVDDDNAHLTGPDIRPGAIGPLGLTITITELSELSERKRYVTSHE